MRAEDGLYRKLVERQFINAERPALSDPSDLASE
jgi:hypothetical protein